MVRWWAAAVVGSRCRAAFDAPRPARLSLIYWQAVPSLRAAQAALDGSTG